MIQTHALDRVIRTAAPDEIPRTRAEKIVLVDLKDKVVVPKKKFCETMWTIALRLRLLLAIGLSSGARLRN